MTKEELEKEATEYAQKLGVKDFIAKPKEIVAYFAYIDGALPREKQIQIDAEHIRALQKQNGELTDKVKEFEKKLKNKCTDTNCPVLSINHQNMTRVAELEAQLEREKNLNQCMSDNNEQLRELIEKMKRLLEKCYSVLDDLPPKLKPFNLVEEIEGVKL